MLGTCRLLFVDRTVQLSRMAVEPARAARGIATLLLREADREAAGARAKRIVLHAQTYARQLYAARRLRAARAHVRGGGDRARRDGEAPCVRCASTR